MDKKYKHLKPFTVPAPLIIYNIGITSKCRLTILTLLVLFGTKICSTRKNRYKYKSQRNRNCNLKF